MGVTSEDRRLLAAIEPGLPLVARPFAALAQCLGRPESEVIAGLRRLIHDRVIRRFGVIVRHRELGYTANAMVVWDVPDGEVRAVGHRLAELPFITLCYQRPRRPPDWPYNLFCMIHGLDRATVQELIEEATREAGLTDRPRAVLFSRRRFKQRGARYGATRPPAAA